MKRLAGLFWEVVELFTGRIRSRDGIVKTRNESMLLKLVKQYWWIIPVLLALLLVLPSLNGIKLPKWDSQAPTAVIVGKPSEMANLKVLDSCHIVDVQTGRRYVAEDCLTFVQKTKAIFIANPAESIIALIVWATLWYTIGRMHERKLRRTK